MQMHRWLIGGNFILGFLGMPIFASVPTPAPPPADYIVVPPTLARITDSYVRPLQTTPEFIIIQDVHTHPEVQSDIAAIIVNAYRSWGVKKVFLEGAFTTVDLSMFQSIPQETRTALLHRLVQQGNLSGPELAAVLLSESELRDDSADATFQLIGMENSRIYRENLEAYQFVLSRRPAALAELENIRRLQETMHIPEPNLLATQLERTQELVKLKLTPGEYDAYWRDKAAVPSSAGLDPVVHAAETFYRLVNARSDIFLEEALRKVPAATGPRVLVVGGFHTTHMAEKLRQLGHSYIVLSPHVTQTGFEGLYAKRMMESISALQVVKPFADLAVAKAKISPNP